MSSPKTRTKVFGIFAALVFVVFLFLGVSLTVSLLIALVAFFLGSALSSDTIRKRDAERLEQGHQDRRSERDAYYRERGKIRAQREENARGFFSSRSILLPSQPRRNLKKSKRKK